MRSVWKIPNFYKVRRPIFSPSLDIEKPFRLFKRCFLFSSHFIGRSVSIHNGKSMFNVAVKPSMVGYGAHSFSFSKKMGSLIHGSKKKLVVKKIKRSA